MNVHVYKLCLWILVNVYCVKVQQDPKETKIDEERELLVMSLLDVPRIVQDMVYIKG